MPHRTDIEWADYSSNPLRARTPDGKRGWGCEKVSPGCLKCYSETLNKRFGTLADYSPQGTRQVEHYTDEKELRHMLRFKPKGPFKNGRDRAAVFPFDMTDLFGEWNSFETIDKFFAVFALRPDVDWLVLTKRPERAAEYLATRTAIDDSGRYERLPQWQQQITHWLDDSYGGGRFFGTERAWDEAHDAAAKISGDMLPNVWLGTSGENQKAIYERHYDLPAAGVRFWSLEPLLGAIDCEEAWRNSAMPDWVIVGGESGHKARPCDISWLRSIVQQCKAASVPVFVKQLGANVIDHGTTSATHFPESQCWPEGTRTDHHRVLLRDKKGGDESEWPEDLRGCREFPTTARVA